MRKLRLSEVVEVTQQVHGELGYRCSQNLCFLICKMGMSHCAYLLGCSEDERAVCVCPAQREQVRESTPHEAATWLE